MKENFKLKFSFNKISRKVIHRTQLNRFFVFLLFVVYLHAKAQPKALINVAPTLKSGQKLGNYLRLGYRAPVDSFLVITIKFKISATGVLDILFISKNAPDPFVIAANQQLSDLNGKWNPQIINGKPSKSKWLILHFYIGGFRESNDACTRKLQQALFDAYREEEMLFLCERKMNPPLTCLIDHIEGHNCYLYPPLLSNTVR